MDSNLDKLYSVIQEHDAFDEFSLEIPAFVANTNMSLSWDSETPKDIIKDYAKLILSFGKDQRDELQRHVFAYYKQIVETTDWLEKDHPVSTESEIWSLVQSVNFRIAHYPEKSYTILVAGCEVDWEEEHGMEICWRNGTELIRVSPQGGGFSYSKNIDEPYGRIIYEAYDYEFTTYEKTVPKHLLKEIYESYKDSEQATKKSPSKQKSLISRLFSKLLNGS